VFYERNSLPAKTVNKISLYVYFFFWSLTKCEDSFNFPPTKLQQCWNKMKVSK